jgi:predicted MFS family arabinose efflux permease
VKTIFAIIFFVLFLPLGMRVGGFAATELIATQRFENPDQVAQFTTYIEYGISFAVALVGAVIGTFVGGALRPLFFRKQP